MALSSFEIGATVESLVNVEQLTSEPLLPPLMTTQHYDDVVPLASGGLRGVGTGILRWKWDYITAAQRAVLRILCPGASAQVFIQVPSLDDGDVIYACTMVWPAEEKREMGGSLLFELEFRNLVVVGD